MKENFKKKIYKLSELLENKDPKNNFILACDDFNPDKGNVYKHFVAFERQNHIYQFLESINKIDRNYYEVLSNYARKPYFDVDITGDNIKDIKCEELKNQNIKDIGETAICDLLDRIEIVMKKYYKDFDPSNCIDIYESHRKNKQSYHLIINNYKISSDGNLNKFNPFKEFFNEVVNQDLTDKYGKNIFDNSVYGKSNEFRLLGNSKILLKRVLKKGGNILYKKCIGNNFKKYCNCNFYITNKGDDKELRSRMFNIFYNSFVSVLRNSFHDETFREIPIILQENKLSKKILMSDILSDKIIMGMWNVFDKTRPDLSKNFEPTEYYSDNSLMIKRIKPSYCTLCKRTHNNCGNYLSCHDHKIFYNCKRAHDAKIKPFSIYISDYYK